MKNILKKLFRESLLTEKLTEVDSDVDLLYDTYFREGIDYINKLGFVSKSLFERAKTNTSILTAEDSVKSNELNPCTILVNHNINGNHYNPNDQIIGITVNQNALDYVVYEFKGDLQKAIDSLDEPQRSSLSKEFTEERIKGSIHHELAHWIDDTLHNKHIKKRVDKAMELGTRDFKGVNVNSTKMEIQGQIHNVKQAYNKYKDVWNEMTFQDLIAHIPTLYTVNKQLSGDIRTKWLRDLKTRMHREGLLGNKMR